MGLEVDGYIFEEGKNGFSSDNHRIAEKVNLYLHWALP
jgi:hypothetical protein